MWLLSSTWGSFLKGMMVSDWRVKGSKVGVGWQPALCAHRGPPTCSTLVPLVSVSDSNTEPALLAVVSLAFWAEKQGVIELLICLLFVLFSCLPCFPGFWVWRLWLSSFQTKSPVLLPEGWEGWSSDCMARWSWLSLNQNAVSSMPGLCGVLVENRPGTLALLVFFVPPPMSFLPKFCAGLPVFPVPSKMVFISCF